MRFPSNDTEYPRVAADSSCSPAGTDRWSFLPKPTGRARATPNTSRCATALATFPPSPPERSTPKSRITAPPVSPASTWSGSVRLRRAAATATGRRDLRLACHREFGGYSDVYGRMSWDRPASGLTTRCISYSNGRFGHPDQDRAISVREAACLQTFPMDFQFAGSLSSMARQIGNAVPVRLATVVGRHVKRHLAEAAGA